MSVKLSFAQTFCFKFF